MIHMKLGAKNPALRKPQTDICKAEKNPDIKLPVKPKSRMIVSVEEHSGLYL